MKNKKKLLLIISVITIIALFVIEILCINSLSKKHIYDKKGYVHNIKWGTEWNDVELKLSNIIGHLPDINYDRHGLSESINNFDNIEGCNVELLYRFSSDGLWSVEIEFVDLGNNIEDDIIDVYTKIFSDMYGEYRYIENEESRSHSRLWITSESNISITSSSTYIPLTIYFKSS